jgi:hypothetical protein
MKIKNRDIEPILLTLAAYDSKTQQPVSGLLFEDISLGLKRRLQKLSKDLVKQHDEFIAFKAEIDEKFKNDKGSAEYQKEIDEFLSEEVEINQEPVSLEMIEKIQSKFNYDFEIIEKFAK